MRLIRAVTAPIAATGASFQMVYCRENHIAILV
jgi:hypothetical protein